MEPGLSFRRNRALTLTEVIVVVAVLAFLAIWANAWLPEGIGNKRWPTPVNCINSLKQIGVAFRLWEQDHNDKFPPSVSVTNGGAMEPVATGDVAACFRIMSNELTTPKILLCPQDPHRVCATNFSTGFGNDNISYFVNPEAVEMYPQMILDGVDNLTINGTRAKPGILTLWTHSHAGWTKGRHGGTGFLGMADGSVQQATSNGLHSALTVTGVTNRWVIP
jgi:prepilin-type N-terminal cleavage/methylation domain-containing protein